MASATSAVLASLGGDPPGEGIQVDGLYGLAIVQIEQGDLQLDGLYGSAIVQIEQGDLQLDGLYGLAIVQTTYP